MTSAPVQQELSVGREGRQGKEDKERKQGKEAREEERGAGAGTKGSISHSMDSSSGSSIIPIAIITGLVVLGSVLYFTMGSAASSKPSSSANGAKKATNSTAGGHHDDSKRSRTFSNMEEKFPAGKLHIYFGSQTGTAEGFARIVRVEAEKKGFEAKIVDLEDFDPEQLKVSRLAIFIVATYGEGDPTDNAAKFLVWLKNEAGTTPVNFLENVDFTVFGLGNKQYEHYNKMGKLTNSLIEALGAKRVFEYGEGDDDCSLEEDFEAWRDKLFPSLLAKYHPEHKNQSIDMVNATTPEVAPFVTLTYECVPCQQGVAVIPDHHHMNTSTKHFFTAPDVPVTVNRELRQNDESGSTVHVEFNIDKSSVTYFTADNLAILPENSEESVEKFARRFGYDLNQYIKIESVEQNGDVDGSTQEELKYPFPTPCTIRTILKHYLDILGIPRRKMLEQFLPYLKDQRQKDWLHNIVSKAERETYKQKIEEEGQSFSNLLFNELSSCEVPLSDLCHIIPMIQPRYYTISSSSSLHPKSIHITVSIHTRQTPSGRVVQGLCSNFIRDLLPGKSVAKIFVRESSFRLPASVNTPIIMIGPGTGIAPMRALLQERKLQREKMGATGKNILYFGCKTPTQDYIYKDELESYVVDGTLTDLHVAFSRQNKDKVYVQDLLKREADVTHLHDLIVKEGAYIFVCGGTGMGASVSEAVADIIAKGMSKDDALALVKEKQHNKSYVQELWSV